MRRPLVYTLLLAGGLLLATPHAFAHAILVRSTPAERSVVHVHTITLVLDYNSRIDVRRSTITLAGPGDRNQPLEKQPSANPAELKATSASLVSGSYRIHWQVLAADGHITRGTIEFTVAR